jgi:hypothetical protein
VASAYKILGQGQVGIATGVQIIDTVPAGKSYIISSLNLSHADTFTSLSNVSVYAVKSGESASPSNAILYNIPMEANTDVSFTLGITLGPGESLYGESDEYFNPTFTAFGEEITL